MADEANRREPTPLCQEDRDMLIEIRTTVKANGKIGADHERRLRKTEAITVKHTMSHSGLWLLLTAAGGWLGLR
tara:strand:- start:14450 stop:14671 length:222 start_codon:yes stop_codon:yes gene_type:complete